MPGDEQVALLAERRPFVGSDSRTKRPIAAYCVDRLLKVFREREQVHSDRDKEAQGTAGKDWERQIEETERRERKSFRDRAKRREPDSFHTGKFLNLRRYVQWRRITAPPPLPNSSYILVAVAAIYF